MQVAANPESILSTTVNPEDLQTPADILKSVCQTQERLYTFLQLYEGSSPKHIAQDLDITRSALQFYIDDWKEHDLIYVDGKDYIYTEKGEKLVEELDQIIDRLN